jgi:hypothetical protein
MSRRSHYRGQRGARPVRPDTAAAPRHPAAPPDPAARESRPEPVPSAPRLEAPPAPAVAPHLPVAATATVPTPGPIAEPARQAPPVDAPGSLGAETNGHAPAASFNSGCTAPQLRRFIKSRAWVPMHELRRRFGINGAEDDVTPVAVDGTTIFVGLPQREGMLLGELLRGGDIGYELSLDPSTPIVIGVYPMRPVPRH